MFRNDLTKTDRLSMVFGREDRYSFAYQLWIKSLIRVEKHLRGLQRNSSSIAGQRNECESKSTFNSGCSVPSIRSITDIKTVVMKLCQKIASIKDF